MWCQKRFSVWRSCKAISSMIEMCCCTHLALCDDFTTFMEWPEPRKTLLALFFHAFRGVFLVMIANYMYGYRCIVAVFPIVSLMNVNKITNWNRTFNLATYYLGKITEEKSPLSRGNLFFSNHTQKQNLELSN